MAKLAATTYGEALFALSVEESKTDILLEEARAVIESFSTNEQLSKLLNHPKIDKEEKKHFIEDVFGKVVSKDITGLLVLMVAKDRQKSIVDALKYFEAKVLEYKKIGKATVTTAKPLSEEWKKKVVDKLLATTDYVDFEVTYTVDESLIGGMVIRIGDRVVDSSIKTKLDELARDLKKIQLA